MKGNGNLRNWKGTRAVLRRAFKEFANSNFGVLIVNLLWAEAAFMLCRVVFFVMNYDVFAAHLSFSSLWNWLRGALLFDVSALLYLNIAYIVLLLLPLHWKERRSFYAVSKWIFLLFNGLGIAGNLADCVYFQYTGRRTTFSVFAEFANETNIPSVILAEGLRNWWLLVVFVGLLFALYRLYRMPKVPFSGSKTRYYIRRSLVLLLFFPCFIYGIRGSLSSGTRPITISNANSYIEHASEAALVLNTPFSIIRTVSHKSYVTPKYMSDSEMEKTYSPIVYPQKGAQFKAKNVVILIMESFSMEYSGFYNPDYYKGKRQKLTPFLDSLAEKCLSFKYSFANGRKSQDALPSIIASIPMFVEPFVLTDASLNDIGGLVHELKSKNYSSAFFHGGENISMGFAAFAKQAGFDAYFGFNEYASDKKYGGRKDWDGKWAVWDEEFLQFFADRIDEFSQPFIATCFTASSHSPFNIPKKYKSHFPEGDFPMYKCLRYSDMSLRRFFEKAEKSKWFRNTIFVIVADHTSPSSSSHAEYQTDLGVFAVPILFYAPDGSLKAEMRDGIIVQQIDIMPTLLGIMGYDKPYIAFGCDALHTPAEETCLVNYNNGIYQFAKGDLLIQFDGTSLKSVYNYKQDPLLQHNIKGKTSQEQEMLLQLKAIIQQYMQRMNTNRLLLKTP